MSPCWLALLPFVLGSCTAVSRGWDSGWTEHAAQDRIMLVRNQPETLGHRRLIHQSMEHPDLDRFLKRKGVPDFIAETRSDQRQYMILYYLKDRSAFATRARRAAGTGMEFAGPYPITARESSILQDFQTQAGVTGVSQMAGM